MYGILAQIGIVVALTHGLRVLGRVAGPRRCGLALGLPSATALMLLACGREYGDGEAMAAAEASLLGLVASAALPLIYARSIGIGARPLLASTSAIAGYVAVASVARAFPDTGAAGRVGLAILGVLAACGLSRRVRDVAGEPRPDVGSGYRPIALGTLVPAALVVMVRLVRAAGGPVWAGLFTTFPAMSLAVLATTHLESGPDAARRVAGAMPSGNLIMIVYLTAFRFVGPRLGLGWGTACSYTVALAALLTLEGLGRAEEIDFDPGRPGRRARRITAAPGLSLLADPAEAGFARWIGGSRLSCGQRTRRMRRFSPRIESLAG